MRRPTRTASSTHTCMLVAPSGTKGTTSVAPMRGCTPRCVVQVDQRRRARGGAEGGFGDRPGRAGDGQHHAVVHRVGVAIEHARAARRFGRGLDRVHDLGPGALAEVGHALDQRASTQRRGRCRLPSYWQAALNHPDSQLDPRSDASASSSSGWGRPIRRRRRRRGGGRRRARRGAGADDRQPDHRPAAAGRRRGPGAQHRRRGRRAARSAWQQLGDADAEAFEQVSAAYKLPRADDAQKAARSEAIQAALQRRGRRAAGNARRSCADGARAGRGGGADPQRRGDLRRAGRRAAGPGGARERGAERRDQPGGDDRRRDAVEQLLAASSTRARDGVDASGSSASWRQVAHASASRSARASAASRSRRRRLAGRLAGRAGSGRALGAEPAQHDVGVFGRGARLGRLEQPAREGERRRRPRAPSKHEECRGRAESPRRPSGRAARRRSAHRVDRRGSSRARCRSQHFT